MKKKITILILVVIILLAGGVIYAISRIAKNITPTSNSPQVSQEGDSSSKEIPDQATIVENLTIPWGLAFLPDETLLIAERPGNLLHLSFEDGVQSIIEVEGVEHIGEGGLLGIALHPQFENNNWVYLYLTTTVDGGLINRVERYRWQDDQLANKETIFTDIPGARFHDGGRIAFGPDGYLYIATGDAGNENSAQDTTSLAGKILRLKDDGTIPEDNPFNNAVYSYGHRNPQGLTWDNQGRLWSTEHGRSVLASGFDELNLIESGKNYGWPRSEGNTVLPGTVGPALHSTADITWAPASALYWDGSIFFGGLRGETLYEAVLSNSTVTALKKHFVGEFGRLRTVELGPDGLMYLTTSNRDGRGSPQEGDDKIIRLNPAQFRR